MSSNQDSDEIVELSEEQSEENDEQGVLVSGAARPETITQLKSLLHKQEDTRSNLAIFLTWIFGLSILLTFVYIFVSPFLPTNQDCKQVQNNTTVCIADNNAKDLIPLVLTPLTTVLGTAIGFYFGSKLDKQ